MKRHPTSNSRGHNDLAVAMALLINNQAAFIKEAAEVRREMRQLELQTEQRFQRIEAILLEHTRRLQGLTEAIQALPEAIREKIGFKRGR